MRIATWNVNSIRMRLERVCAWMRENEPDVLCLQETKVQDGEFPREAFADLGYEVLLRGQKTWNGVAILSRRPGSAVQVALPGDPSDGEARYLSASFDGVDVINVYVPNGQSVESPKFSWKLSWLDRLVRHLEASFSPTGDVVVTGDFNVAPEDRDVHDPEAWRGKVLFHPREHEALGRLKSWGLSDVYRRHHDEGGRYSWWDYRALSFPRNAGLRIDLILATASLASRSRTCEIDRQARKGERPSDHAPVLADFGPPA